MSSSVDYQFRLDGGACFSQEVVSAISLKYFFYDRFAWRWCACLQMLSPWRCVAAQACSGNQQWFLSAFACLAVLLTNDKLYFRKNCFSMFVD